MPWRQFSITKGHDWICTNPQPDKTLARTKIAPPRCTTCWGRREMGNRSLGTRLFWWPLFFPFFKKMEKTIWLCPTKRFIHYCPTIFGSCIRQKSELRRSKEKAFIRFTFLQHKKRIYIEIRADYPPQDHIWKGYASVIALTRRRRSFISQLTKVSA